MMKWIIAVLFLLPAVAFAGEDCVQTGGVCKERCGAGEEVLSGAFMDCSDKQDCCAKKEPAAAPAGKGESGRKSGGSGDSEKK